MTALQVKSEINIELDKVLDGMSSLETQELEKFMADVGYLLAKRRAPSLSMRETELLQCINQGIPVTLQKRYDELRNISQKGTLSASEREELLTIVEQIEIADAKRLEYLIELAQLRQVSLDDLMKQLGLTPPPIDG